MSGWSLFRSFLRRCFRGRSENPPQARPELPRGEVLRELPSPRPVSEPEKEPSRGRQWREARTSAEAVAPEREAPGTPGRHNQPPKLEELLGALGHRDHAQRRAAAESLGRLGPAAGGALPTLIQALVDAHETV